MYAIKRDWLDEYIVPDIIYASHDLFKRQHSTFLPGATAFSPQKEKKHMKWRSLKSDLDHLSILLKWKVIFIEHTIIKQAMKYNLFYNLNVSVFQE